MKILLTNDDGIDSPGLQVLKAALEPEHEVWVIAPESNRSGTSHGLTLGEASRIRKVRDRTYAASGTPVDCVLIAAHAMLKGSIDLVLSGINQGPNLGTDVLYSGTAAAAREAALQGIPGVALSLCRRDPPLVFDRVARFVAANAQALRAMWSPGFFLNLNFPGNGEPYRGVRLTRLCVREYNDRVVTWQAPRGDLYCVLTGDAPAARPEDGSDSAAVDGGMVSVSPLPVEPGSREEWEPPLDTLALS